MKTKSKYNNFIDGTILKVDEDCTVIDFTKGRPNYITGLVDGLVFLDFKVGDTIELKSGKLKNKNYSSFNPEWASLYKAKSKYDDIILSYNDVKDFVSIVKRGYKRQYYIVDKSTKEFITYTYKYPVGSDEIKSLEKPDIYFSNLQNSKKFILSAIGCIQYDHYPIFVPPYHDHTNLEIHEYDKISGDLLNVHDIQEFCKTQKILYSIKKQYGMAIKEIIRRSFELNSNLETIVLFKSIEPKVLEEIQKICKDMKLSNKQMIIRRSENNLAIGFDDFENASWLKILFSHPNEKYYKIETIMKGIE